MQYVAIFVILVGCFLAGMMWMRVGLFHIAGEKPANWLKKVTNTPVKGMLAGILMTGILQSSSAVMVITIGFVSTKLLLFSQTIGIILGTNIGTTITLELISFPLSKMIIPFSLIGIICIFFDKTLIRSFGYVFIGFACIFASMKGFEKLAHPLMTIPAFEKIFFLLGDQLMLALFIGVILTGIIQSSTVMTGIAMSFLSADVFPLETGIAIMLGANIGTCITALLASTGGGEEAKLTAFAHIWLNLAGVFLCLPFIHHLAYLCSLLSSVPSTQLAHASVIFNIVSSLIVLPFATQFGNFIIKLHSKKTRPFL